MHVLFFIIFLTDFISLSDIKKKDKGELIMNLYKKYSEKLSNSYTTEEMIESQKMNKNSENHKDMSENLLKKTELYVKITQLYKNDSFLTKKAQANRFDLKALSDKIFKADFYQTKEYENIEIYNPECWTEENLLRELNHMRYYIKTAEIDQPGFLDTIFQFSEKLSYFEKNIYRSFSKYEIAAKRYIFGFDYIPCVIFTDRKYLLFNDLVIFSFVIKDNIESILKKGYVLYAFFLLEVIMTQSEKIIAFEPYSTIYLTGNSEKKKKINDFEFSLFYLRIIFSKILFVIDDEKFRANIYFHTALLSFACYMPKEMNRIFKTYFFKVLIDLLFSLGFYVENSLSDKLLFSILDLVNDVLVNQNKKISILKKVKDVLIYCSDNHFLQQNIRALKFYKQFYNIATLDIQFCSVFNAINMLTEDEIVSMKFSNIKLWLTRLIETRVCFTLIKIHYYNYTLIKTHRAKRKINFKAGIKTKTEYFLQNI